MTSILLRLAALLFATGLAGSAFAQEPTPSHLQAAQELIQLTGALSSLDTMIPVFGDQIKQRNITRPDLTKDLDEVLRSLQPELQLQKAEIVALVAKSYAKFFTEDELRQLTTFFRTPVGVKFLKSQVDLIDEVADEVTNWSQQVSEYVMFRTRAEMLKRGQQMQ